MILRPNNQTKLYNLNKYINELINLFEKDILPNKILLSGQKGLGKSTLAYHFVNFILSQNEEFPYDSKKFSINENNKSYKLVLNQTSPNFHLIDVKDDKKNIDINQIRNLINYTNKSSFNNKQKLILIDNIEFLNLSSINALLKIIEEPNFGVFFILINNNKKVLPTLKSRCLDFKINLDHKNCIDTTNKILELNILDKISSNLLNYYQTPGKLCDIYSFSKEYDIDLKDISLEEFLKLIIDEKFYKKNYYIKTITLEYIEMFFLKMINLNKDNLFDFYSYFLEYFKNVDKYNLDEDSFFLDFKSKMLNG